MMICNKNFRVLLVATIGVAVFISCENKPGGNSEESLVVGEWSPISWVFSEIVDGEIVYQNTVALDTHRTFQPDGTGWETRNFGEDEKDNWQTIHSFKWNHINNKIFFTDVKFIPPQGVSLGAPMWKFETEWSVIGLTATEMKVEYTQDPVESDIDGQILNVVTFEKVK